VYYVCRTRGAAPPLLESFSHSTAFRNSCDPAQSDVLLLCSWSFVNETLSAHSSPDALGIEIICFSKMRRWRTQTLCHLLLFVSILPSKFPFILFIWTDPMCSKMMHFKCSTVYCSFMLIPDSILWKMCPQKCQTFLKHVHTILSINSDPQSSDNAIVLQSHFMDHSFPLRLPFLFQASPQSENQLFRDLLDTNNPAQRLYRNSTLGLTSGWPKPIVDRKTSSS